MPVYISTVCLERNRWGSRQPSYRVSEWLPRFAADGFDGIELWENHWLAADAGERDRLMAAETPLAVYNTYAAFSDEHAEPLEKAAGAIEKLAAGGVKYNLGNDPAKLSEYRRNLLKWADRLPATCKLLCECHPGTILEEPAVAAKFFADLDPNRFGVIVHVAGNPDVVKEWFSTFGSRVAHLHVQMRDAQTNPALPEAREKLDACFSEVTKHGYQGSVSIEFTRGIGRDEDIETLYANARADMAYCRKVLS
ncbi:MAG: hypothetical protein RRC34_01425 [Lentisphaeria bacterium]|nr:hypothetical protein [Lentisphaeria bacterium]